MSDTPNYRGKTPPSCGFTEAEIEARAVSKSSQLWKVRCLNGGAHKHDDSDPSAYYYPERGWYGCNVCGVEGFATDRLYANQPKRLDSRRSGRNGNKRRDFRPDRIPANAKLTATHLYKRVKGKPIHRVRRYDWTETADDGSERKRKEYLPQHLVNGQWKHGTGKIQWEPYNADQVAGATIVYVVEGEKCADALKEATPATTAVITSAFGTNSAWKTDWTCLRNRVEKEDLNVVFIPDCDKPGEKYIHSIAWALGVESIRVACVAAVKRDDGYDVADWLSTGHSFAQLPVPQETRVISKEEFEEREKAVKNRREGKPQLIRETAYEREVGNLTVDERIDRNSKTLKEHDHWLIHQFIAVGESTIIFGHSGSGKTTIVRSLVRHIVEGSDPFLPKQEYDDQPAKRGRVLWWLGEEKVARTIPKFEAAGLGYDDVHLLDRGHKWTCEDLVEIQTDGSRSITKLSPHTDLLNRIDKASAAGHPYRAIVIDPLSTMIGDTNKADLFEKRWDETIVTLESRGLAVICIVHPRKDNNTGSTLEASLKGTERLFSLPRVVAYVRSAPSKPLLQQSREHDDGVTHTNPIRDRFNATGEGNLDESSGSIGVLSPLKNNHVRLERLLAWQYSLVNVPVRDEDEGSNVSKESDEKDGVGVAEFSSIPWRPKEFDLRDLDGKSFGAAVAGKYELYKGERQTKQEQLAEVQLEDRHAEGETIVDYLTNLFKRQDVWTPSDLEAAIQEKGNSPNSGAFHTARRKVAKYDATQNVWRRKEG